MRHFHPPPEHSSLVSPALAPSPWPFRPAEATPRRVRLPMAGTGRGARRPWLRPAASLVISSALVAVFQF